MIREMDLIVDASERLCLVVPGQIAGEGPLELGLYTGKVALAAGGRVFVEVSGVAKTVLDALARQGSVGLIESPDPENPAVSETHRAQVQDFRNKNKG